MRYRDAKYIFDNPLELHPDLPESELTALKWFINLTSRRYFNKGYFVGSETWRDLTFPDVSWFDPESCHDSDLLTLYKNFAWRGFLRFCQPDIRTTESGGRFLAGFKYLGKTELPEDVLKYMLRYPSVDWINATLLNTGLHMSSGLRCLIEENKIGWARAIHGDFKKVQARNYALMYLMDYLPFIVRSYTEDFDNTVECYTRSASLIRALCPDQAEGITALLHEDKLFDTPISNILRCVKITAQTNYSPGIITHSCELVELDLNDTTTQYLPYHELSAYVKGYSERINDNPLKAAVLTLDLQKSGLTQRYCTLNSQVFREVYSSTDALKVNIRSRFKCELDIGDFSFKYWNLQASIHSERHWSAFSPFSLRSIRVFNMEKLNKDVLQAHHEETKRVFVNALKGADTDKLKALAVACGISPVRPMLESLLRDYADEKHPSELYAVIQSAKSLFG